MKTLIYGAGPIGRWLALKLGLAGKDVTLLARSKAYRSLKKDGIQIVDGLTGERLSARVKLVGELRPEDRYDLVVVPMVKSSRLAVCPILAENPHLENILFLGNDVAGADAYLKYLPRERVLLGFPSAGGGWQDGELVIVDRDKPRGKGKVYFGELDGQIRPRTRRIRALLASSGLEASLERDMDGWLKYHFAFIGPTAGAIYKHGLDMQAVADDPEALHQYCQAAREAGDVLQRVGYRRRQPWVFNLYYWLPRWLEPKVFAKLFGSPEAQVRFGLHAAVARPELLQLAEEFAALKAEAGLETPALDALLATVVNDPAEARKAVA
jgi:2-dehydropantoate 2-reductase